MDAAFNKWMDGFLFFFNIKMKYVEIVSVMISKV